MEQHKRYLCYKHHCDEFDKLPGVLKVHTSAWKTVDEQHCELCQQPNGAESQPSYLIIEGDPSALRNLLDELEKRNYLDNEFYIRLIAPDEHSSD